MNLKFLLWFHFSGFVETGIFRFFFFFFLVQS